MIRILKGADFGNSAIDTIVMPEEISALALQAISRYSGLQESKKKKLVKFITALEDGKIYDKIRFMLLPTMATNVNDSLQNIVSSTKDVVNNSIATLDSEGKGVTIGVQQFTIGNKFTLNDPAAYSMCFKVGLNAESGTHRVLTINGTKRTTSGRLYYLDSSLYLGGYTDIQDNLTWINKEGVSVVSFNHGSISGKNKYTGNYATGTYEEDENAKFDAAAYLSDNVIGSTGAPLSLNVPIEFLAIGEPMTSDEMDILYNAVSEFLQ